MNRPPDSVGEDPRILLDRLVRERGEDYAALSRLVGRNPAYIQQFNKRGTPRRLGEHERGILARYFRIDEALLGAPEPPAPAAMDGAMLAVRRLDIGASAGGGALVEDDRADAQFAFDQRWLRRLTPSPRHLAIIRVEGDSMAPTLCHGDDIMVDSSDAVQRLRDGIYVLRRDGVLLVKRLACGLGSQRDRVTIISDNAAYPTDAGVAIADLDIVGRVLWTGRLLR